MGVNNECKRVTVMCTFIDTCMTSLVDRLMFT